MFRFSSVQFLVPESVINAVFYTVHSADLRQCFEYIKDSKGLFLKALKVNLGFAYLTVMVTNKSCGGYFLLLLFLFFF